MPVRESDRTRKLLPAAIALAIGLVPTAGLAAESCPIPIDDVKAAIEGFASKASSEESNVEKDFKSVTGSDYTKFYFDHFTKVNGSGDDTTRFITKAYDLTKFAGALPEGTLQTKMPPSVSISMSNAMELAEAAADEDNTKLDLAELRCNQNTEDAALSAALDQLGSDTVNKFKAGKKTACKLVHFAADLQDKKAQLDKIRTEGYPLFHIKKKDKKNFAGKERTIQLRADLRLYPEYPGDAEDQKFLFGDIKGLRLSYNSYFKWSDNNWEPLNIYQYLVSESDEKDEVCYPQIKLTSKVKVATCVRIANIDSSSVTLKVRGKYWYNGDSGAVSLGDRTIPAPFGYLQDVSNMKDKKMEDLTDKLVGRLASTMGKYGDMVEKAQEWKQACGS
jgi:hypothetical protein